MAIVYECKTGSFIESTVICVYEFECKNGSVIRLLVSFGWDIVLMVARRVLHSSFFLKSCWILNCWCLLVYTPMNVVNVCLILYSFSAFAAEQDAMEENAMLKIEEAKANANMSMELAINKRKRAQSLAQNADLATYKATMLIRIAEAALAAESVDEAAAYFLD